MAKPLNDFFTKAGNVTIFNCGLINIIYTMGWFCWVFGLNYITRRYTGILFLDPFIILFWMLLYFSIRNRSRYGGRELTELAWLLYNKNKSNKITNMGKTKLNILCSAITVSTLLLLLRVYPSPVTYGENLLGDVEDYLFSLAPYLKIERYNTIL